MPDNLEGLVAALLRSSIMLTVGWALIWCLLKQLKLQSVRIHVVAWFFVLMQAVALMPIPLQIPVIAASAPVADDPWHSIPETEDLFNSADPGGPRGDRPATLVGPTNSLPFPAIIAACWLGGVIGSVGWLFASYFRFVAGLPKALPVPAEWDAEWNAIRSGSTLQSPVPLHVTKEIGPAVCWTLSGYRLLIPGNKWSSLSPVQRGLVMRHELAHLERGDLWKALFYRMVAAVQWFNPLAWLTVRKLAECAEWACDDRACAAASTDYVRALLEFSLPPRGIPVLIPRASGHGLVRRAQRLLNPTLTEDSGMKKLTLALAVAALAVSSLVSIELVARAADPKDPPKPPTAAERIQTPVGEGAAGLRITVPALGPVPLSLSGIQFSDFGTVTTQDRVFVLRAEPARNDAPQRQFATKEAVIDMTHVFANLPEFKERREAIQKYVAEVNARMKADSEAVRAVERRRALATGSDAAALRTESTALQAKFDGEHKIANAKINMMESEAYIVTFKQIRKAVAAYAREHDIHIVRRTTGEHEQEKQLDSGDPQAMLKAMNAQVVYISDESIDITDVILERLEAESKASETKTAK